MEKLSMAMSDAAYQQVVEDLRRRKRDGEDDPISAHRRTIEEWTAGNRYVEFVCFLSTVGSALARASAGEDKRGIKLFDRLRVERPRHWAPSEAFLAFVKGAAERMKAGSLAAEDIDRDILKIDTMLDLEFARTS
jgi:hypothetical protein